MNDHDEFTLSIFAMSAVNLARLIGQRLAQRLGKTPIHSQIIVRINPYS